MSFTVSLSSRRTLTAALAVLFLNALVLLEVPLLRQLAGLLLIAFLPGLLALEALRLDRLDRLERLLLSVGISLVTAMVLGVTLNGVLPMAGVPRPLSTLPVLAGYDILILGLAAAVFKVGNRSLNLPQGFTLDIPSLKYLIVPLLLPVLSVAGATYMNGTGSNFLIIAYVFVLVAYLLALVLLRSRIPGRITPALVFLISLSLLLLMAFRSSYIIGIDVHDEYHLFEQTVTAGYFPQILGFSGYLIDSCLSVSILPTVFQAVLGIDTNLLFRTLYPLIFSLAPLAVYATARKYLADFHAFLATCFFMFQYNFIETELQPRTNTAVFFVALAVLVLVSGRLSDLQKKALLLVFIAAVVMSHYSSGYLFFFVLLLTFLGTRLLALRHKVDTALDLPVVIAFFAMLMLWYCYVFRTPFFSGMQYFLNFFSAATGAINGSGELTETVMASGVFRRSLPQSVEFCLNWSIIALLSLGVLTVLLRFKSMAFPELRFPRSSLLKSKIDADYLLLSLVITGLFAAVLLLPQISMGYSFSRIYFFGLVVMSVYVVIASLQLSRLVKIPSLLILVIILIPYLLCVSGVLYAAFGMPKSILLNTAGYDYNSMFIHDQDYAGVTWLRQHSYENSVVYGDSFGNLPLSSYGAFDPNREKLLAYYDGYDSNSYIYLRYFNIDTGKLMNPAVNVSDYAPIRETSAIYDNGGCEIWR